MCFNFNRIYISYLKITFASILSMKSLKEGFVVIIKILFANLY